MPTCKARNQLYEAAATAIMARRALIILDGIDEGGKTKAEIEQHIVSVLRPQGHPLVVTSRPSGLTRQLYEGSFFTLELRPLGEEQQQAV